MTDYTVPATLQLHTTRWPREKRAKYSHYVQQTEHSTVNGAQNTDTAANDGTNTSVRPQNNIIDTIQLGDHIYIQTAHHCTFGVIDTKSKLRIHKFYTNCTDCIGHKYGSTFNIDKSGKCTYVPAADLAASIAPSDVIDSEYVPTATNAELSNEDRGQQQLTQEQLQQLKENASAAEIVQSLIENSTTHSSKTEFSQAKYIAKKLTKYHKIFTVHRVNVRYLAEHYYRTQCKKIQFMRSDGLALLLNTANIVAERCTVVCDHYNGLVLAAAAVKHAGYGTIINLYDGQFPRTDGLLKLGLSEQYTQNILHVPLNKLYQLQQDMHTGNGDSTEIMTDINDKSAAADSAPELTEKQQLRLQHQHASKRLLQARAVNSLIIATTYNPLTLLTALLPYLMPSGTFSMHHSHIEPLAATYDYIKFKLGSERDAQHPLYNTGCINVELIDCWMREYQVLPNRTHPDVNRTGGMGYILTGTKVVNA